MKDQYFGDNRDLFKYDLILQIMQAGLVDRFTFIPMLTENDDSKHGSVVDRTRATVGTENKELVSFLDECVREGKRDIKQLESFFQKKAIPITIYGKGFSHAGRREYFKEIGDELLSKSLILVGPDIGLEVNRSGKEHLLFREVDDLFRRMDKGSILMLYQHFPREDHHEYLHRRSEEIEEKVLGEPPLCIDNNEIIFFFLTKDESMEHELTHIIQHYAESYS